MLINEEKCGQGTTAFIYLGGHLNVNAYSREEIGERTLLQW